MSASRWFRSPRIILTLDAEAWKHIDAMVDVDGTWVVPIHERLHWGDFIVVAETPERAIVRFVHAPRSTFGATA